MGKIEYAWRHGISRRAALANLGAFLAASPLLRAQQDPHPLGDHWRVPGLDEMVSAFDFEPLFYANVPLATYDYTAHGTDSEFTLRRNREAFDWVELLTWGGVDAGSVRIATELFGVPMATPILIAPTSRQRPLHPDGELGMHEAATAARTTMIVSNAASFPVDRIAEAADGPLWFQFYPRQDLENSRAVLEGAQAAGCQAVVVTLDQQATFFERDLHDRNLGGIPRTASPRQRRPSANPYRVSEGRLWYDWPYLDAIRPMVKVPMLAKGILTGEDAALFVEHGLDGIVVSNHGGRSLDYGPSTLEVLAEIVDAVRGRVPVLVDSGFRRGRDVFKALALGADAVCLGRATRWGLAAFGAAGAQRVLEIVQAELVQAMAEAGRADLASIDRTAIRTDLP